MFDTYRPLLGMLARRERRQFCLPPPIGHRQAYSIVNSVYVWVRTLLDSR